jgi:hypothetical protein
MSYSLMICVSLTEVLIAQQYKDALTTVFTTICQSEALLSEYLNNYLQ